MTDTRLEPHFTSTGVFVAFEGGEGAGKSTQSRMLNNRLLNDGYRPVLTREPGGTEIGATLRGLILDPAHGPLSPRTEALLFAADRAEHVDSMLLPKLADGAVVITDRYIDSSLAYQGAGRELDSADLRSISHFASAALKPHLTILLDVDPAAGLTRVVDGNDTEYGGLDRIESETLDFHVRVCDTFRALALEDPEHYLILDARDDLQSIHDAIMVRLEQWLPQASHTTYAQIATCAS